MLDSCHLAPDLFSVTGLRVVFESSECGPKRRAVRDPAHTGVDHARSRVPPQLEPAREYSVATGDDHLARGHRGTYDASMERSLACEQFGRRDDDGCTQRTSSPRGSDTRGGRGRRTSAAPLANDGGRAAQRGHGDRLRRHSGEPADTAPAPRDAAPDSSGASLLRDPRLQQDARARLDQPLSEPWDRGARFVVAPNAPRLAEFASYECGRDGVVQGGKFYDGTNAEPGNNGGADAACARDAAAGADVSPGTEDTADDETFFECDDGTSGEDEAAVGSTRRHVAQVDDTRRRVAQVPHPSMPAPHDGEPRGPEHVSGLRQVSGLQGNHAAMEGASAHCRGEGAVAEGAPVSASPSPRTTGGLAMGDRPAVVLAAASTGSSSSPGALRKAPPAALVEHGHHLVVPEDADDV